MSKLEIITERYQPASRTKVMQDVKTIIPSQKIVVDAQVGISKIRDLSITIRRPTPNEALDPDRNASDATTIFSWLVQYLPAGTFQALCEKMQSVPTYRANR